MIERLLVPPGWTRIGQAEFIASRRRFGPRGLLVFGLVFAVGTGIARVMSGSDPLSVLLSGLVAVAAVIVVGLALNAAFLLLGPGVRVSDDGGTMRTGWKTVGADELHAAVLETPWGECVLRLGAYPGNGPRLRLRSKERGLVSAKERAVLIRLVECSGIRPPEVVRAEQPPGARWDVRGLITKEAAMALIRDLDSPHADLNVPGDGPP